MTNREVNDTILKKFQETLSNTITVTQDLTRIFSDWFQSLVQGAITEKQQLQMAQQPQQMPTESLPPTSDPQGQMQEEQVAS